ncbi:hypothetical protein [Oleomonas cavernae]|uniref:hypothetical protein n=1 Tax=Oleomonas cavernae TaxID=2320859 RepID=UPI001F3F5F3E|nr:hypothetical protein [Oleomonas cavernae]
MATRATVDDMGFVETAAHLFRFVPIHGRFPGVATAGVAPRIMGYGPAPPASQKRLKRLKLGIVESDAVELDEAFVA